MSITAMKQALEALVKSRRSHHYCEDAWYSCPKHEDGCANEAEGDECNCGADKANKEIDQAITSLRQAIEQAEQAQPVAWVTAGPHTSPLRTHWEGCETVHPECKAEQAQPVAWIDMAYARLGMARDKMHPDDVATIQRFLDGDYTAPPQRQPLHDMAIFDLADTCLYNGGKNYGVLEFARAIEAAHGIKDEV